ncbi:DUF2690 domain-containing protein [Kitasatospora sp. NPDC002227]|uniref:DUF2690 domain-containing protein n=1 Tax=Kitasatospora sp. NPDC002227 TaxID=3154773 RepID=UPI003329F49C
MQTLNTTSSGSRWQTLLRSGMAAVVTAGLLTLAGPVSAAHAAGSCTGSGCTGKDPATTGCAADATTYRTVYLNSQTYGQVRYSPSCDAAWIRTYAGGSLNIGGTVFGQRWDSRMGEWLNYCSESTRGQMAYGTQWSTMCGGYPSYDLVVTGN